MTHTPPWVWVIGVVSGVIAGFIWASVDFGRRAQLGEATATVTSVADDLWVAVLFGASVALAVVGIIGFFVRQTQTATASSGATARVSVGNNPDAPNGAPNGGNATQPTRVATTTPPPPAGNPPAGTDGASQPPTPAPASRRLRNPFRRDTGSQPANPTPTPNQAGGSTNASAAAGAGAAVSRS